MTRRRLLLLAGALWAVGVVAILATPLGPWGLARLAEKISPRYGWNLDIGETGGALGWKTRLGPVRLQSAAGDIAVELARMDFSAWDYEVRLAAPAVRVALGAGAATTRTDTTAADTLLAPLPVDYIPQLHIADGTLVLEWPQDSLQVELQGLQASYQRRGGRLAWTGDSYQVRQAGATAASGRWSGEVVVSPRAIGVEKLAVEIGADSLYLRAAATAQLAWRAGLPLEASVELGLQGPDSLAVQAQIGAAGRLQPMALQVEFQGGTERSGWGAVEVRGAGLVDSAAALDSLVVAALGGRLWVAGNCDWGAERAQGRWSVDQIDLAQVHEAIGGGQLGGGGQFTLDWGNRRLDADIELDVRSLAILPSGPIDVQLRVEHRPTGDTRALVQSTLGRLAARGIAALDGSYDMALEGAVNAALLAGPAVGQVQLAGRAQNGEVILALDTERLALGAGLFGPLSAELTLQEQRFLRVDMDLEEGLVGVELAADLLEGHLDSLAGTVAPLALQRLDPALAGTVQGTLEARGGLDIEQLAGSAQLALHEAAYAGWSAGPLALALDLGGGLVEGTMAGSGLAVDLHLDPQAATFAAVAQLERALVVRRDSAAVDSAAVLHLSGGLDARGNWQRPDQLDVRLDLSHLSGRLGTEEIAAERPLHIRYAAGDLDLDSLGVQTPAGLVQIDGGTRGDSLDLDLEIRALDLTPWMPAWKGDGFFRAEVGGTFDRPQLAAQLQARQLVLGQRILGDGLLRAELGDSLTVTAELRQAQLGDGFLSLRGSLPAQAVLRGVDTSAVDAVEVDVDIQRLDLGSVLSFALDDSVAGHLAMSGRLAAPVRLLVDPLRWSGLSGELVLEEFALKKEGVVRLDLPGAARLQLRDDHVELSDLRLVLEAYDRRSESEKWLAAGDLQLDGNVESQRPSRFDLDIDKVDLLVLENLGLGALPAGELDLDLNLQGTVSQPRLNASLDLQLDDYGQVQGELEASASQGEMQLHWSTSPGDTAVAVQGLLPWDWAGRRVDWDGGRVQARSDSLDLSLFLDQLPELEDLGGRVELDLDIQGLGDGARVEGHIAVADLAVELLDTRPRYVFPQGRLNFSGQRGVLSDFVGGPNKGDGRIELGGFVEMRTLSDWQYEVNVEARDLPYRYQEIFATEGIDIDLDLRGEEAGPLVKGRVLLNGSQVEPPLVDLTGPPVPPPPPAIQNPLLERTRLDVFVEVRDMQIENELADLEMVGGVTVYGTFYKPRFQGGMEVVEAKSKVFIFNKEFFFEKGIVGLDQLAPTYSILDLAYDPLLLNPSLDFIAKADVQDNSTSDTNPIEVHFELGGTALQPEPQFSADGPDDTQLDDTQILSLLAFGSSDVAGGEAANTGLYAAAGQLLLGRQIKKIGLDEFQVLPLSKASLGDAGSLGLRMGKFFTFPLPLWVRYEAATEAPSEGEFRVDYNLNSYIVITGTAQSEYDRYGLGIGFDKDF